MAVECAVAIFAKIGEYSVAPIGRQFKYFFYYNNIIDNLKDEVNDLKLMRDGEQMRVDEARNNVQDINPLIVDWLSKVEEIIAPSEIILEETVNVQRRCLNGWCPNLKSRYSLARRATKKTREVVELKGKGKFDWVSCHAAPSATMAPTSTYSSTCFESRKSRVEEIFDALKDPKVNVIGVSGMGGVGKTTMVKEVYTRVRAEGLFDEVAMAVVSQNQDVFKIQGELGNELSLRFDEGVSIRARANKLHMRLKNGKRILIILDDLWEGLDLGEVGLPVVGDCRGCKVLLTSRIERVCKETGTQRSFVVQVLSNEEAWDLFKAKAGNCVDDPDLNSIAKEVTMECCGLPIAIVTLAAALKDRRKHVWSDVLEQLRNSTATNIPGMHKKVYSSIELSYNFLESDHAKSLLLFCCLFPEDRIISVTLLVGCGMGLGIFDDVETLVAKRNRVCSLVDELINCHLLINAAVSDEMRVKLHDIIRDVGISIASKEGKVYFTKSGTNSVEWSENDMHKRYTAIFLESKEIPMLPIGLDFSMLHLLNLMCTSSSPALFRDSLVKMEHLKVLVVIGMNIDSLAQSLNFSLNLSTLRLERCELHTDISFVGSMQNLGILSFKDSNLDALPSTIGQLGNLKWLDLRCSSGPTIIPFGVLSSLKKLEELYMGNYFFHACVEDDKEGNGGAIVTELNSLRRLNTLQITFTDPEVLQQLRNFPFENLKRFDFDMLDAPFYQTRLANGVSLHKINVAVVLEANISVLVRRAARLDVQELGNLKNIFEDLYLWKGVIQPPSLANLSFLRIDKCDAIKSLFSRPVVKCLVQLRGLFLTNCEMLEGVVSREAGSVEENIIFPRLDKLVLEELPKLRNIYPESEDIIGTQNNRDTIQTLFNQQNLKMEDAKQKGLKSTLIGKLSIVM